MRVPILLLFLVFTTFVSAQDNHSCIKDSMDIENRYSKLLISAYNTKGIYLVDTICIEDPVIIVVPHNTIYVMSYLFYLNNKWSFSKSKIKKMLHENEEHVFIYDMEWYLYTLIPQNQRNLLFYDKRPKDLTNWETIYQNKKGYKLEKPIQKPDYFLLFLVRGDIYNKVTYDLVMDNGLDEREEFKDPKAYYKIAVPVWKY